MPGDLDLVLAARQGSAAAFATLMQRNNQRLYRLARGVLRDEAEAEEAVQEGYLRAFAHINEFKGEASVGTWLARIVVNEALGRLRRRRKTVELAALDESTVAHGTTAPISSEPSPEHAAARGEIRRLIESAIDALPPPFRTVFMLRAVEQLSVEETAACLGVARETVKTRFHRANRLLRQRLHTQLASSLDDVFPFAGARCKRMTKTILGRLGLWIPDYLSVPDAGRPAPFSTADRSNEDGRME
jgi:RNA polymerase sigma-70 factor (ECF subfamily)